MFLFVSVGNLASALCIIWEGQRAHTEPNYKRQENSWLKCIIDSEGWMDFTHTHTCRARCWFKVSLSPALVRLRQFSKVMYATQVQSFEDGHQKGQVHQPKKPRHRHRHGDTKFQSAIPATEPPFLLRCFHSCHSFSFHAASDKWEMLNFEENSAPTSSFLEKALGSVGLGFMARVWDQLPSRFPELTTLLMVLTSLFHLDVGPPYCRACA